MCVCKQDHIEPQDLALVRVDMRHVQTETLESSTNGTSSPEPAVSFLPPVFAPLWPETRSEEWVAVLLDSTSAECRCFN